MNRDQDRTETFPPEADATEGVHLRGGAFREAEALAPPAAFLRGALYCIYPRAFTPEGTLAAAAAKLDHVAALGASAIWLLPIHPVGAEGRKGSLGSPYAIRDYRAVDPALGTMGDLRRLVRAAHERGLRVLLDFVANHAANDHVLAPSHPEWFARDEDGRPARRVPGWTDVADWRHQEPGVADYLIESASFWIREADVDGFRCDVAGMVPAGFWLEFHRRLQALRTDHFLLAEWQDARLHAVAFHASYDWLLYRALRDTALGKVSAAAVTAALDAWRRNFPKQALPVRFLENHDEPRAVAVFGRARIPAYAAVAFLSGGMPLLYNGQELGLEHRPSLFEREPIPWDRPGDEFLRLYREWIALQRGGGPWAPGEAVPVETDQPETVVAFRRPAETGDGLVVANLGRHPETVTVKGTARTVTWRRVAGRGCVVSGRPRLLEGTPVLRGRARSEEPAEVLRRGDRLHLDVGGVWIGEAQP